MNRRVLVVLLSCLLIVQAHAQVKLLDHLQSEIVPLDRMEKLFVLKEAENKITDQVRDIFQDPHSRTPQGRLWAMKILAYCYGTLALVWEPHFPALADIYRERTELYSDVVRGKLTLAAVAPLEQANEEKKAALAAREIKALPNKPNPSPTRMKYLTELGPKLGLTIAAHAKSNASKP
jgi:hypothetical protein